MMMRLRSAAMAMGLLALAPPLLAQDRDAVPPGHTLGDPGAPVTVVEYADFACSACAEFSAETWPRVRTELVETGRISWRLVPFALGFRHGGRAARAAECAGDQGAFWPMHDRLFRTQGTWMSKRNPEEHFRDLAREAGLDPDLFQRCVDDDIPEDRIDAANEEARDRGVRATPTFLVNGRPVLGAVDFPMFLLAVEEAEKEAGNRPSP